MRWHSMDSFPKTGELVLARRKITKMPWFATYDLKTRSILGLWGSEFIDTEFDMWTEVIVPTREAAINEPTSVT